MGKSPLSSKTIRFHLGLTAVQSIAGGIMIFEPFVSPLQYAVVVVLLGVVQSVGGIYLRFLTQEPIK